jgi:aminoglycoside phosphotransferase family enzyme/predicted kinase
MSRDQDRLIEALKSAKAYAHATEAIRVIETHISWVLLTGKYAYKIKKAVSLPFVDFTALASREACCRDELWLNRRLAPDLYIDVVPIGGSATQPEIGATPAIEYAVRMRQFPADATADQLLARGALGGDDATQLARRIACFHAGLEPVHDADPAAGLIENLTELEAELRGGAAIERIGSAFRMQAEGLAAELARRAERGCLRECHGDLHLGNVARIDGDLIPFDCLEFSRELRTVDLIDELAFLFMDLMNGGRRDLAFAFVDSYLAITGDYSGLLLLRFFAAHRALVRAKVAVLAQDAGPPAAPDAPAGTYLRTAQSELVAAEGVLLITHGLSGSGKSTIAGQLALALGAVRIRSDVERKRLQGLAATESTAANHNQGIYSPRASAATYDRLLAAAESALRGRIPFIVDAAFLDREQRAAFAALARRLGMPFLILHCSAPTACLHSRLRQRAARNDDPSDADAAILEQQIATADELDAAEAANTLWIDTTQDFDCAATAAGILSRTQVSLSSTSY